MRKHLWKYGVAVVSIVIVLIIINQITAIEDVSYDVKSLDTTSWDDVKAFHYKHTPGLKRAEKLGLAKKLDLKIDIPHTNYSVTIDEVWYNKNGGFLFYHVNSDEPAELLFSISSPDFKQSNRNFVHMGNITPDDSVIYNRNYYSRVVFGPVWSESGEPFTKINELKLDKIKISIGDEQHDVPPVTFALNYDESMEQNERVEIDKEIDVGEHKLYLDYIEIGTVGNTLAIEFRPGKPNTYFSHLRGDITTNYGENFHFNGDYTVLPKENKHLLSFPAYNDDPEELTVSIDAIKLIGDEAFTYELKLESYKKDMTRLTEERGHIEKEIDAFIAEKHYTDITLDRLIYQPSGLMFGFKFSQDDKNVDVKERLITASLIELPRVNDQLKDFAVGMIWDVRNEKGERAQLGGSYYGSEGEWGFDLDYLFLQKSKSITITVENLLYEVQGDWQITVKK